MALQTPGGLAGQPILILREGSTQSRGKQAQARNIQAAQIIAEVVKATLGPQGLDKLLVDTMGDLTITNETSNIQRRR
jgi:chaperonin GroEL (HSP60 family)